MEGMYGMQDENMNIWPRYNMKPMGMCPYMMDPMMYNPMMYNPMMHNPMNHNHTMSHNHMMHHKSCDRPYQMIRPGMCPMMNNMNNPQMMGSGFQYMEPNMNGMMCPMMEMDMEKENAPYVTMKAVKVKDIQD